MRLQLVACSNEFCRHSAIRSKRNQWRPCVKCGSIIYWATTEVIRAAKVPKLRRKLWPTP
jgi:hypothetical protein